jgi:hypothetical protein
VGIAEGIRAKEESPTRIVAVAGNTHGEPSGRTPDRNGARGELKMDVTTMSREDLISHIQELNEYMENVIVFWGGKRELLETLRHVAENKDGEFTKDETLDASAIVESGGAFEELVELLRDSFDRGGINFAISEKMSAIMETVGAKYRKLS